jgi:fucose permease
MKNKYIFLSLLPVFFGFFVMGFVDVVGIATSYVKEAYNISEQLSGFLPSMVFIWFLLLAIPSASLMNKIGRKNMVLLSMLITLIGMSLPLFTVIHFNLYVCFVAFALLGIGNTLLQVSLNPLVSNLVNGKALTSSLTAGQVVKAISSFCGPFIAVFAATQLNNWIYLFPIFGGITLISALWLLVTPVEKEAQSTSTSLAESFKLLNNKSILLLFLGIVAVVGIDVGVNMVSGKMLLERIAGTLAKDVSYAPSIYFACRTIGAFIGSALLIKMDALKYFRIHILLALVSLTCLIFAPTEIMILILIGLTGYACSSIFSIIFSMAMQACPEKANDISGFMVTGSVGGAIFPPVMTFATSLMDGKQAGALIVLIGITAYLMFLAFGLKIKKQV